MLTKINLPDYITGALYRAPMPGASDWPMKLAMRDMLEQEIELVLALPTMGEIKRDARAYARMLEDEAFDFELWDYPIPDGAGPEDEEEFLDIITDLALEVSEGSRALIHCNHGVGRSGMAAICTLVAMGLPMEEARQAVSEAGANPETPAQDRYIAWFVRELARAQE